MKRFGIRFAALLLPVFCVWLFLSAHAIVHLGLRINEMWVYDVYKLQSADIVQNSQEEWQIETNLFNASKPYPNNSYHPNLTTESATSIALGSLKSVTLCFPLFWLLLLSYKPRLDGFLVGTCYLLLLLVPVMGLHLVLQIAKTVIAGGELLREFNAGYVTIPAKPPEWVLLVLKPLVDASTYLLILAAPLVLWWKLSFRDIREQPAD